MAIKLASAGTFFSCASLVQCVVGCGLGMAIIFVSVDTFHVPALQIIVLVAADIVSWACLAQHLASHMVCS